MEKSPLISLFIISFFILLFISCAQNETTDSTALTWEVVQDSTNRVNRITGFSGPEAVRYDPAQDVYFVANFAGGGGDRDANGFISRVLPDGTIDSLQFMTGTDEYPLHAPRGMYISGDTLWAADIDGVHGFDSTTGEQAGFIDFTEFEPGFLNDIVSGPDRNLYVTDTGTSRLYKAEGNSVSIIAESLPHPPNGITLDPSGNHLVIAPWNGGMTFYAWDLTEESLNEFVQAGSGGNFDGIEYINTRLLVASQQDSSLHIIENGQDNIIIHVPGPPADIGVDTDRNQVAVPYIALDRVDIWQLPKD